MQRLLRRPATPPALNPAVAANARNAGETPSQRIPTGADAGHSIAVYETQAAHRAAVQLGVAGFSYRNDVFLARGLDEPGGPGRSRVLQHEITHALQAQQGTRQAGRQDRQDNLFAADPDSVYGWLWIPFVVAFIYLTTRSNTANAPKPGDK